MNFHLKIQLHTCHSNNYTVKNYMEKEKTNRNCFAAVKSVFFTYIFFVFNTYFQ